MQVEWCRRVAEDGGAAGVILIAVVYVTDDRHQCLIFWEVSG